MKFIAVNQLMAATGAFRNLRLTLPATKTRHEVICNAS
jgi:hypothetical protein